MRDCSSLRQRVLSSQNIVKDLHHVFLLPGLIFLLVLLKYRPSVPLLILLSLNDDRGTDVGNCPLDWGLLESSKIPKHTNVDALIH